MKSTRFKSQVFVFDITVSAYNLAYGNLRFIFFPGRNTGSPPSREAAANTTREGTPIAGRGADGLVKGRSRRGFTLGFNGSNTRLAPEVISARPPNYKFY